MTNFYLFFHDYLQKKLKDRSLSSSEKYEVCVCSNILGNSFLERLSTAQSSFRRDLRLVLEAAGVKGAQLVISDDSRFINTVIRSNTVRRIFKTGARDSLGISPFPLHIKAVGEVVNLK